MIEDVLFHGTIPFWLSLVPFKGLKNFPMLDAFKFLYVNLCISFVL